MSKVFVVMGTTGEYSDSQEWAVIAYMDEEKAKEHVINAERRAKELFVEYGKWYGVPKGANEFDPEMRLEYTGTSYFYLTVELRK